MSNKGWLIHYILHDEFNQALKRKQPYKTILSSKSMNEREQAKNFFITFQMMQIDSQKALLHFEWCK